MSSVAEKVKKIVVEQLGVSEDQVTIELVMALEEEFGSDIPDEDAEKMTTVGEAIKYIESKSKE